MDAYDTPEHDLEATANRLHTLAQGGHLTQEALERALALAGHIPGGLAWEKFLGTLFLILGTAFTLSGVFFFFAFNWAEMHHFLKFGLVEGAIVIAVSLAFYKGLKTLPGKLALLGAALLVGALLAVYGQVYQTGADAYQLFVSWAALIAGWAIISAFTPLWFLLWALINTSLITYWGQAIGYYDPTFYSLLFVCNGLTLLGWEYAHSRQIRWLQNRWTARIVAMAALIALVIPTLEFIFVYLEEFIFDLDQAFALASGLIAPPLLYAGFTLFLLFFYQKKIRDRFMLTIYCAGIVFVLTAAIVNC